MKTHINVVSLINVVTGAFFTGLGVVVPVGVLLLAPWFYGAPLWKPGDAVAVFAVVSLVGGVFFVLGIPLLIAGIGLRSQKKWARTLAIIVAILSVPSFPLGTAAGLYALWVLTQKETALLCGTAS